MPFVLPSPPLRLTLCPRQKCPFLGISFYLKLSGTYTKNSLFSPPLLSGYNENGSPVTHFFQKMTSPISWLGEMRSSCHTLLHVVPLLLLIVSTLFFSQTGGVLSHLTTSTYWSPRCPLRSLCFLATFVAFSLVFTASDKAFYQTLISLKLAE